MCCKVQGHWYIMDEEGRMDSMVNMFIDLHFNPQHGYYHN
jgi:hypothetical protein